MGESNWELSCGMSCMRRDKRVIVEREGEAKTHHLPGASSSHGFKRIQADNASINVFLGKLKPSCAAQHRPQRNVKLLLGFCTYMATTQNRVRLFMFSQIFHTAH